MNESKNKLNDCLRKKQKKIFALLAIILILSFLVGGTLAYIAVSTNQVTNQFEAAYVSCRVNVNDNGTITITNTGNVDAYIRATFIVNWMEDNDSGNVYGIAPVKGEQKGQGDYYVTPMGTEWTHDSVNDIYYYPQVVKPGVTTKNLVAAVHVTENAAPDGYKLSVEVVAEAIQADGTGEGGKTPIELCWGEDVARLVGLIPSN